MKGSTQDSDSAYKVDPYSTVLPMPCTADPLSLFLSSTASLYVPNNTNAANFFPFGSCNPYVPNNIFFTIDMDQTTLLQTSVGFHATPIPSPLSLSYMECPTYHIHPLPAMLSRT